jgi:hypothetical protein
MTSTTSTRRSTGDYKRNGLLRERVHVTHSVTLEDIIVGSVRKGVTNDDAD